MPHPCLTSPVPVCAVAALTCAVQLSACGTTAPPPAGSERAAAHAFERYLLAVADADGERACAMVTPSYAEVLRKAGDSFGPADSCVSAIEGSAIDMTMAQRDAVAAARVRRVTLHGTRATIDDHDIDWGEGITGAIREGNGRPTELVRLNGSWKISSS